MKEKQTKHVTAFITGGKLRPGERYLTTLEGWIGKMMGSGRDSQRNGALIVTNQRVAFYRKGIFGEVLETIPFEKITSIETRSLLGHRVLTLHTSHDDLSFKTFESKDLFDRVHGMIENMRDRKYAVAGAPSNSPARADAATRIQELKKLLDAGLIDPSEFAEQKARIISAI